MKTNKIQKYHFNFTQFGFGLYKVYYYSTISKIEYTGFISDMEIIDKTKNCEYPKAKDLRTLKNKLTKIIAL